MFSLPDFAVLVSGCLTLKDRLKNTSVASVCSCVIMKDFSYVCASEYSSYSHTKDKYEMFSRNSNPKPLYYMLSSLMIKSVPKSQTQKSWPYLCYECDTCSIGMYNWPIRKENSFQHGLDLSKPIHSSSRILKAHGCL